MIRQLAAGRSVLDMCCFSGGFALSAAAGGASTALGVDSSAAVVELAGRNAELNGLQGVASFVRGDVVDFMKQVGPVGCRASVRSCLCNRCSARAIAYLLGSAMLLRCAARGLGCSNRLMNISCHAMLPCRIHTGLGRGAAVGHGRFRPPQAGALPQDVGQGNPQVPPPQCDGHAGGSLVRMWDRKVCERRAF